MPPKSTSAANQMRKAGAVVHACAHLVLGDKNSKRYFGNRHFNSTKLQGVVKSTKDGSTKPDDRATGSSISTLLFPIQTAIP